MKVIVPLVVLVACQRQPTSASDTSALTQTSFPQLAEWQSFVIETNEEMREVGADDWNLMTTTLRGVARVTAQGEHPTFVFQPCAITLPEISIVRPTVSDEQVQQAGTLDVTGRWTRDGDGSFTLDTPSAATLSLAGVTVKASLVHVVMNITGSMRFSGAWSGEGVVGEAEFSRDMTVLDDNVFGAAKHRIERTLENSEVRPAGATVELKPLTGATRCDELP